jgi:hypothetical protein
LVRAPCLGHEENLRVSFITSNEQQIPPLRCGMTTKKPSFTTKSLPLYNKKKLAATQQKTRR